MNVINPLGRELGSQSVTPCGCQCSNWDAYTGARGSHGCATCGCQCDVGWYQSLGNNNGAHNAGRAST